LIVFNIILPVVERSISFGKDKFPEMNFLQCAGTLCPPIFYSAQEPCDPQKPLLS